MYSHHGGDNQTWSLDTEGLISSQLDPGLFLTEVQGDVLLSSKKEEAVRWSIEEGGYFAELKKRKRFHFSNFVLLINRHFVDTQSFYSACNIFTLAWRRRQD